MKKYVFFNVSYNLYKFVTFSMRYLTSNYITLAFFCKNVTLRHGLFLKLTKAIDLKLMSKMLHSNSYKMVCLDSVY